MEFGSRTRKPKPSSESRIHLYRVPPVVNIEIDEFERLALLRQKLLQEVDTIRCTKHSPKDEITLDRRIYNASKKYFPLSLESDDGVQYKQLEERRKDHISHYILRLAYCRNEEMRRWFLTQETELLRSRLLSFSHQERKDFLQHYKEEFCLETVEAPEDSKDDMCSFYHCTESEEFYKIPFTAALDLIRSRSVVIRQGCVYLPENSSNMIVSLICSKFRARLSEELVKTLHHVNRMVEDDERIVPFLNQLKYQYLGEDFSSAGSKVQGKIDLQQLNMLSKESFPPCMRHLHDTLRREHHLKHFARLQYGLFLKSIGLTLDQALSLWRTEFIKKMEPEKFEKQYAYNIRHSYGKEGKRADYTAYSCIRIIMGNSPGQGDCHGCPFKHWDEDHVQQMLLSHGLPHTGARHVMSYVQERHYQLACQKYFEITHGVSSAPFSLEHPTQFYLESRKIRH